MFPSFRVPSRVIQALHSGVNPRDILVDVLGVEPLSLDGAHFTEEEMRMIIVRLLMQFQQNLQRPRAYINSMHDIISIFHNAQRIVCIIGAGASIGPDFRSPGGLYDMIARSGALEDPYQVFDLAYFATDPTVFWRFAHLIYPKQEPDHSQTHFFLAKLESMGKLLRVYSQNVDTLEIGIPDCKLRCVHGSWRENKCVACGEVHGIEDLRQCIEQQIVPQCKKCQGPIKPGIVFFGQKTNIEDEDIEYDTEHADLLIVIGTSLRVAPVSYIPQLMQNIPAILINREPVTCSFSAELLGDCDAIIGAVEKELGWREEGHGCDSLIFTPPNKFLLPSENGIGTQFIETGRSVFLVTPTSVPESEF
jgi:NAD-dependent SIR2 family protein deacetylase